LSRYNPYRPNSDRTIAAAAEWRDRCLIQDRSILADASLWTAPVLDELDERFVRRIDTSQDKFQVKLRRQLAEASPLACQLAAEMLWLMNLFPSNIGPDAKRAAVTDAWSWSGEELPQDHPMLDREVLNGLGSAGPGFLAHRWRELRFFINSMRVFKALNAEERRALLSDPFGFAKWLDEIPDQGYRQLKHILPYLLFPDEFERISGPGDIRRILSSLGKIERGQLKRMSKVEQDEALLHLRRQIEASSAEKVDFYQPTLKKNWAPSEPEAEEQAAIDTAAQPNLITANSVLPLNLILYGPPGTGKTYRTVDRAIQIMDPVFADDNQGDREALKTRYDELVEDGSIEFVTFHQSFSYEDFVEGLRAEATADGSINYYVADGVLKSFCRSMMPTGPRLTPGTEFARGYVVMRSTDEILWLKKPNGSNLPFPWELLDELSSLLTAGRITLEDVRQGKVFEKVPESRLEKYIVNGYANILPWILEAITNGSAHPQRSQRRVLIIDEINRGNISKIFGELITLLEPTKRAGASEALTTVLPYSKQPFSVPSGLHIIGTMNTADRSLAAIDIALRRRFVFEEVEPDVSSLEGIEIAGVDVAGLLDAINARIERLLDRDHRIGHAYFIGLSASDDIGQLRSVFATQVIPLLQEYFFDDWQRVRLVLNDHRKSDPADQFIVERSASIEQLFGPGVLEVPTTRAWQINLEALDRPSAYRSIIN
jgi:5-methylcytosine-specific restriction protein B